MAKKTYKQSIFTKNDEIFTAPVSFEAEWSQTETETRLLLGLRDRYKTETSKNVSRGIQVWLEFAENLYWNR